jgi:hypothetical protein
LTAGEFAFLALGLVLGVASGAALIEVLRARPPAAREIRVTVAPNAIHARLASTLAAPLGAGDAAGPAAGGPGDRRWRDEVVATGEPATTGRRLAGRGWKGAGDTDPAAPSGTPVLPDDDGGPTAPFRLTPTPTRSAAAMVAVPMSMEPDPDTAALRASAALSALAAMTSRTPVAVATGPAMDANGELVGSSVGSSRTSGSGASSRGGSSAGSSNAGAGSSEPASSPVGQAGRSNEPAMPPAADGPCAEERRVADERCAVATRAREGAVAAADALRRAQRSYDEIASRAEAAATTADPRAVRTAKELAQQRFRDARTQAGSHEDVENGAREWLAEINRINHDTREAALAIERDRAAAIALGPTLERLTVEADAARISAERADEACIAAREAVAACDEARNLELAAERSSGPATRPAEPADEESGDPAVVGAPGRSGRIAAATPEPEDEFAFSTSMNSQAGQEALIVRILRGDREAMQRAVARLAGDDEEAHRRWQAQLGELVEALIARSIEASAFDFPIDHPFWGAFNQAQNRDIAAGLSSLGFRFDGFGDWVEEHQPSQRDLSMAVGYAGLDPMRIRRWPNEAEMRDLFRDVRVAADEYIAGAAGGLTLGELVTLLGRRADGLTELWNQWGSVRPILLEAS